MLYGTLWSSVILHEHIHIMHVPSSMWCRKAASGLMIYDSFDNLFVKKLIDIGRLYAIVVKSLHDHEH